MFRKVSAVNVAGKYALHVFQTTYNFISSNQSPYTNMDPSHDQNHARQRKRTYLKKYTRCSVKMLEILLIVRGGKVYIIGQLVDRLLNDCFLSDSMQIHEINLSY